MATSLRFSRSEIAPSAWFTISRATALDCSMSAWSCWACWIQPSTSGEASRARRLISFWHGLAQINQVINYTNTSTVSFASWMALEMSGMDSEESSAAATSWDSGYRPDSTD